MDVAAAAAAAAARCRSAGPMGPGGPGTSFAKIVGIMAIYFNAYAFTTLYTPFNLRTIWQWPVLMAVVTADRQKNKKHGTQIGSIWFSAAAIMTLYHTIWRSGEQKMAPEIVRCTQIKCTK